MRARLIFPLIVLIFAACVVPFAAGRPAGNAEDVLTGIVNDDGEAMGRPVGVTVDRTGALLVADDVGDVVWRVTPAR